MKFHSVFVDVYISVNDLAPFRRFCLRSETLKQSLKQIYNELELQIMDYRKFQQPETFYYTKSAFVPDRMYLDTAKFHYVAQGY